MNKVLDLPFAKFQSTSSAWRTTREAVAEQRRAMISIHVLRVEDDSALVITAMRRVKFQSTSSVWRTTRKRYFESKGGYISIHVLRVEDDRGRTALWPSPPDFNPRPPCGGRLRLWGCFLTRAGFQSTSSVWRTTSVQLLHERKRHISIHVLRVEDDPPRPAGSPQGTYFNPRPPCGGRPGMCPCVVVMGVISIHVLRVEDDVNPALLEG